MKKGIKKFKEETGYLLTEKDNGFCYDSSLYLRDTGITSLPDNLTAGGSLYLGGTGITDKGKVNRDAPDVYFWKNKTYIKADGIFSKVVSQRGNIYKIQQIGCDDISYLITDGNGKWSHGKNFKEAKEDLIYKISSRDKSEYKYLTLSSEVSFEKAIEMYRVITGACSFGAKDFVNNRLNKKKSIYTIAEIIELTKGEYGNSSLISFFQ